jgi:hypothetical protein
MASTLPKTSSLSEKSRVKAVAAKISAARELARRLAEEKQAAVAAVRADADSDRLKRSTEEATAVAAAQVGGCSCGGVTHRMHACDAFGQPPTMCAREDQRTSCCCLPCLAPPARRLRVLMRWRGS